jgi:hypothetical protein
VKPFASVALRARLRLRAVSKRLSQAQKRVGLGTRTGAFLILGFAVAGAEPVSPDQGPNETPSRAIVAERNAVVDRLGGGIRGVTVGPIENALHAEHGYGSASCAATMQQVAALGGNWVSLTPFGRVWNLSPSGIDLSFEAPFESNKQAVRSAIRQAHAQGLRVMLVPHLWVESGGWRGEIDFKSEAAWKAWSQAYETFIATWARVAEESDVELFSVGVELRSWVTSVHAPSFLKVIERVRRIYKGPLTYAANWDDAEQTTLWGKLDVIGVNAFYPLADREGQQLPALLLSSKKLAQELRRWSQRWAKPVLFTEIGYTARPNPALRPWEWPENLGEVPLDTAAQADAYLALLAPHVEQDWFLGFFVWRFYADPFDVSQEPEWGFSPLHKPAELVLRSVFEARWAVDRERFGRSPLQKESYKLGLY